MARVSGVDIPREKRVEVALTYVFGIGRTLSKQTLAETGMTPTPVFVTWPKRTWSRSASTWTPTSDRG